MINAILGKKADQLQGFLEDGTRIPVTQVNVPVISIVSVRTKEKNGYNSIQVGIGLRKKATKALAGQFKELQSIPEFSREILVNEEDLQNIKVGDTLKVSDLFKPGDLIDVTGTSKGKGYAGVVKRHHFKGGPATHGQSDRERAPGSIGQTTTPGRVYKGKRMAGKMGSEQVTVKNLTVADVSEDKLLIKGLVPGTRGSLITVKKTGENKKFVPLFSTKQEVQTEPKTEEIQPKTEVEARSGNQEEVKEKKEENAK